MSALGYSLAYGQDSPFEGDEGSSLAMLEAMKTRIKSSYYTPNLEVMYDLEKISKQSSSHVEFMFKAYVYLNDIRLTR